MLTAQEIERGMNQFTGTEQYHRLYPNFLLTDGVKWLAESAGCYWLLDIIWSYQPRCRKDPSLRSIQFWTLNVHPKTEIKPMSVGAVLANKSGPKPAATVICERDTDDIAITQKIPMTDFPLNQVKIWVQESDGNVVAMLPSEY